MTHVVRALRVADAEAFRRTRLDALRLHPDAFGAAYEDEAALTLSQFTERLVAPGFTRYGGFAGTDLVGLVGLQMRTGAKEQHKARLFSMYVAAAHRGSGLAPLLIETVIAGARDAGAVVLQLSVEAGNARAQRLYQRMGFSVYGIERRSLKVAGRFHDEALMALDLD
ncbi:MAG: GNAT family N-acetyltransferase [Acetobacteraceae bacterium]